MSTPRSILGFPVSPDWAETPQRRKQELPLRVLVPPHSSSCPAFYKAALQAWSAGCTTAQPASIVSTVLRSTRKQRRFPRPGRLPLSFSKSLCDAENWEKEKGPFYTMIRFSSFGYYSNGATFCTGTKPVVDWEKRGSLNNISCMASTCNCLYFQNPTPFPISGHDFEETHSCHSHCWNVPILRPQCQTLAMQVWQGKPWQHWDQLTGSSRGRSPTNCLRLHSTD